MREIDRTFIEFEKESEEMARKLIILLREKNLYTLLRKILNPIFILTIYFIMFSSSSITVFSLFSLFMAE